MTRSELRLKSFYDNNKPLGIIEAIDLAMDILKTTRGVILQQQPQDNNKVDTLYYPKSSNTQYLQYADFRLICTTCNKMVSPFENTYDDKGNITGWGHDCISKKQRLNRRKNEQ